MTEQPRPQPDGVVISGGTVNIGALAQGSHARASNREVVVNLADGQPSGEGPSGEQSSGQAPGEASGDQRAAVEDLIRELLSVLRQHDGELADSPTARSAAEDVSGELDQEQPDASRIRRLLDKIAAAAGPIAEIAAAVAAVQRAITGMP